jgi:hypothetical protein
MKLTKDVKSQIDQMTPHQIYTMFRFHPTDITAGESGKYMQDSMRERAGDYKKDFEREQKRKVFRIT